MYITIVGAGPVGLLLSCLLSVKHKVTVLDKRVESSRYHTLNIDKVTVTEIINYLDVITSSNAHILYLKQLLLQWTNPVSTVDIETSLTAIAINLGVVIRKGVNINNVNILNNIKDAVVIGTDGARSNIREIAFNNEITDTHTVHYMAQIK